MLIDVPRPQAVSLLGAMRSIALAHGERRPVEVGDADRRTIEAAAEIVFALDDVAVDELEPRDASRLAAEYEGDPELAVRVLAVMSLVDGRLDADKNELVDEYADALDVHEDYLDILTEAVSDEIAQASACIVRKNAASFPHLDIEGIDEDAVAPFLPYRDGNDDPELEVRYRALGELPTGSFGRAFFDHFDANGFEFPGNPNGLAEGFTTPHDSSHVLSGYSTSELGELCVSTFIGAMHPDHPMAAEVLPVLFSWHLGIKLNAIANSNVGKFEPRHFWTAWERGAATTVDVVAEDWDFWAATPIPLAELRQQYRVPPVADDLLA